METVETQEPPPPSLDPSLAPALLFYCGRGGADPEKEGVGGGARLIYSIPKRRLLLAGEVDHLFDDVNWITPQGWMLTLDPATSATSLRDPFTSRAITLPPDTGGLLAGSNETTCVMSTLTPADPGCVVLVIHLTDPVLCYCRPGGTRWLRHEYRPELLVTDDRDKIIEAVVMLTAVGGRFYADWDDKLATFEFSAGPTLSSCIVPDRSKPAGCYFTKACMVASCGELFRVQFCYSRLCGRRILRVLVQKLDSTGGWMKVTGLGTNRVFFVSSGQFGASMCADKVGLKSNCIYFMIEGDKGLYVYSIEQGTTTLHSPGIEIPDDMTPILLMPVA
ncbi:unnamed protein product [Urochloa humidicola]